MKYHYFRIKIYHETKGTHLSNVYNDILIYPPRNTDVVPKYQTSQHFILTTAPAKPPSGCPPVEDAPGRTP